MRKKTKEQRDRRRAIDTEYEPIDRAIWVLFDTCNGHAPVKRYVWWFDTKKDAIEHKKWQHQKPNHAELSGPYKFYPENIIQTVISEMGYEKAFNVEDEIKAINRAANKLLSSKKKARKFLEEVRAK